MKLNVLSKIWNYEKLKELGNRKLTIKNEYHITFPSTDTKKQLIWKRSKQMIDIRIRARDDINKGEIVQVILDRNDVFLMAARFLPSMSEDDLIRKIKVEGGYDPKNPVPRKGTWHDPEYRERLKPTAEKQTRSSQP